VIGDPAGAAAALAAEAGLDGLRPILGGVELRPVAVGWATVDLDRATHEYLASGDTAVMAHGFTDELLGARGRRSAPASTTGVILLEPRTEGLLAAALARRDEGPAVLYLAPVHGELGQSLDRLATAGIRTRRGDGPFGAAALVLGRPVAGPQLILVGVPSGS
jgi:hypothetical protein